MEKKKEIFTLHIRRITRTVIQRTRFTKLRQNTIHSVVEIFILFFYYSKINAKSMNENSTNTNG